MLCWQSSFGSRRAGGFRVVVYYLAQKTIEVTMLYVRKRQTNEGKWLAAMTQLTVVLSLMGCGKHTTVSVYPVQGTVRYSGAPASGAKVVLYATDRHDATIPFPTGIAQSDGSFKLSSYKDGDGAPAGTYNVAIEWLEPIPAGVNREMFTPSDRLHGKYANPERSNLKVTVEEGRNDLPPFDLN
jgi:hypothetical protein